MPAAIDKIAESTTKADTGLKTYLERFDRAVKASGDYAAQQAKIAELTEKYWDQQSAALRRLAAAQEAAAKENEKRNNAATKQNEEFAASIKNFIQNPLAAAGDAAENFAVQYGKAGVALLSVGTAAAAASGWLIKNAADTAKYAQEISNLASRTGLTTTETQLFSRASEVAGVNAGTLTTAMRTLSRGMSENSDEGKKQKEVLKELGMGADAAFRPMGQLLPELFQRLSEVGNVLERDRMTITLFGRSGLEMEPLFAQFKELEARVHATGVVMDEDGIKKGKEYEEQLRLLGQQWDALKLKLGEKAIGVIEFVTGGDLDLQKLGRALLGTATGIGLGPSAGLATLFATGRTRFSAPLPTPPPDNSWAARQEQIDIAKRAQFSRGNADELDRILTAGEDPKDRIRQQLKEQQDKLTSAENKLRGAADESARDTAGREVQAIVAKIRALKDEEKAISDLKAAEERLIELRKRSQEILDRAMLGGEESPAQRLSRERNRIALERDDAIRKSPQEAGAIREQFGLQETAAGLNFVRESAAAVQKLRDEIEKMGAEGQKLFDHEEGTIAKAVKEYEKTGIGGTDLPRIGRAPAPPPGYVSPEEQLRMARDTGRRDLALVGVQARLGGLSEADQIQAAYQVRKSTAEAEYAADLKIARQKHDLAMEADALAKKEQEIFDARLEQEQALLQIALKQKEEFQNIAVGFVNAAQHGGGGLASFMRAQLQRMEDTVVSNLAGMAWPTIQKSLGSLQTSGTLGKILQGTPFGPDPLKTAGGTLTAAGVSLTNSAQQLTAAARALAGAGRGGSGGIGGIGSGDVNAGGGGYGMGSGAGGDTGYTSDGVPKYSPDNYDDNGIFLGGNAGHDPSSVGALSGSMGASGGSALSAGKLLGYAGAGAAAVAGISNLAKGGVRNVVGGVGELAGAAAIVDPEPISKMVLAGIALTSSLVTSILGDPRAARAADIQHQLTTQQFFAPVAINAAMTSGGGYADYDRFGGIRGSDLSPFPTVQEPYALYRQGITVPGRTLSQFGGGPNITVVLPPVTAMDGQDVSRVLNAHLPVVGDVVNRAVQLGHAPALQETLRNG